MMELASDAKRVPDAYNATIHGVEIAIQWVGDDGGFRGWAFDTQDGHEIAQVGPFKELKRALGKIGTRIRDAGYWEEC